MCGGSKTIKSQALARLDAAQAVRTVADHACTEQWRGVLVGEGRGQRVRKILAHEAVLGVTAILVVSGKAGLLAQIFSVTAAVRASTIGRIQPGNAHPVSGLQRVNA